MAAHSSSQRSRARRVGAPSTFSIDISLSGARWAWLPVGTAKRELFTIAAAIARHIELPGPTVSASIVLAHDAEVRRLNGQWRAKDKPTNVLSFPAGDGGRLPDEDGCFLGDVILAAETIEREADEQGKTRRDHFRHLATHGLLHLLGYDHEMAEEAEVMEGLERLILADVGVADPYADVLPQPPKSRAAGRKRIKPVDA